MAQVADPGTSACLGCGIYIERERKSERESHSYSSKGGRVKCKLSEQKWSGFGKNFVFFCLSF